MLWSLAAITPMDGVPGARILVPGEALALGRLVVLL